VGCEFRELNASAKLGSLHFSATAARGLEVVEEDPLKWNDYSEVHPDSGPVVSGHITALLRVDRPSVGFGFRWPVAKDARPDVSPDRLVRCGVESDSGSVSAVYHLKSHPLAWAAGNEWLFVTLSVLGALGTLSTGRGTKKSETPSP